MAKRNSNTPVGSRITEVAHEFEMPLLHAGVLMQAMLSAIHNNDVDGADTMWDAMNTQIQRLNAAKDALLDLAG